MSNNKTIINRIKNKIWLTAIKIRFEKHNDYGKHFLFIPSKNSTRLVIIFSGLNEEKPLYNYVKTLTNAKINKLYILDEFGYGGGYYLMENGSYEPEQSTTEIIENIIKKINPTEVYTVGSSKGGTAAIYYGVKFHVTKIYAAAFQYRIGWFLNRPHLMNVFNKMAGNRNKDEVVKELDNAIPSMLEKWNGEEIEIFYSKNELTYERQIIPFKQKMAELNIPYTEIIETFERHEDVGNPFSEHLKTIFCGQ